MCDLHNAGASGSGQNAAQTSYPSDERLQPPPQQLDGEQDARLMALMQYWRRTMSVPAQQQPAHSTEAPPGTAAALQDARLPVWSPAMQQPQPGPDRIPAVAASYLANAQRPSDGGHVEHVGDAAPTNFEDQGYAAFDQPAGVPPGHRQQPPPEGEAWPWLQMAGGLRQGPASAQSLGEASPRAQACSTTPSPAGAASGAWQPADQAGACTLAPGPAAAPASRASQGSYGGSASEDDHESQPSDGEQGTAARREELRARNRESARRSRARKRDHVMMLREENERLRQQVARLQSTLQAAAAQGYLTIDQALAALTGSP